MSTYAVQIGNTDNKLTQQEWSDFVDAVERVILSKADMTHFNGGSAARAPWQNHCWVFDILGPLDYLRRPLKELAMKYRQDSIAVTVGETEFVTP